MGKNRQKNNEKKCHGPPHENFSFFLAMRCWVEGSGSDSKQKVRHYFIFFHYFWQFLPIFSFFGFLAHFAHFTPPYDRPLITYDPILYFHVSWVQLAHGRHCRQKRSMNLGFFFWKMTIFPFLVIFAPFSHGHGRPHDPTKTFNIKCAVLGSYHSDIYEKKAMPDSLQVHYPSNLMPGGGQNWSNSVFHVCALPWATPCDFFIFFGHDVVGGR